MPVRGWDRALDDRAIGDLIGPAAQLRRASLLFRLVSYRCTAAEHFCTLGSGLADAFGVSLSSIGKAKLHTHIATHRYVLPNAMAERGSASVYFGNSLRSRNRRCDTPWLFSTSMTPLLKMNDGR